MDFIIELIFKILKNSGRDITKVKNNQTKSYFSISFYNKVYLRIKYGLKTKYIAVPSHLSYMFSLYNINATVFEIGGWHRIYIDNADEILKFTDLILGIFDFCYTEVEGETFGCCSKYIECSDAKACIHEHEQWSKGCSYRNNLIKGRIFYGKNTTIK